MVAEQLFKFVREVNSSSALLIVLLQVQKRRHYMEISTTMFKNQLIWVSLNFSHYLQPQLMSQRGDISNGGTLRQTKVLKILIGKQINLLK